MKKRTSVFARILAALALVAAVVAIIVITSAALKNENSSPKRHSGATTKQETTPHRTKAKTYTVKTGDTLIAIAHQTGVPVSELLALNPEVDPQILIAGEVLKLK